MHFESGGRFEAHRADRGTYVSAHVKRSETDAVKQELLDRAAMLVSSGSRRVWLRMLPVRKLSRLMRRRHRDGGGFGSLLASNFGTLRSVLTSVDGSERQWMSVASNVRPGAASAVPVHFANSPFATPSSFSSSSSMPTSHALRRAAP